jgi:hypothetical protein
LNATASAETGPLAAASARRGAGRYELGDIVARGGTGTVHRGVDKTNCRRVAIKRLKSEFRVDGSDESQN